jgi:hypothetical protein
LVLKPVIKTTKDYNVQECGGWSEWDELKIIIIVEF